MMLGTVLVLTAVFLLLCNNYEAKKAENSIREIMPLLIGQINAKIPEQMPKMETESLDGQEPEPKPELEEIEIDGFCYIGYLTIPDLELELPVMSEWDYARLRIAPCRYAGSAKTNDLVIAAHNYAQHFGMLSSLSQGALIYFTDVNGDVYSYKVSEVLTMNPTAIDEMINSEYEMTLFTCTYGGTSRVTVRCERFDDCTETD